MNQLQFNAVIEGVRTRQDRSLGLTVGTGELTSEEKMTVMELQNVSCSVTFSPTDGFTTVREIKSELSKKSVSERVRACLFVWWHQLGEPGTFQAFYEAEGEKIINNIKSRLKPI
jgi:hypothetical protein